MSLSNAELSSISSTLEELVLRLGKLANTASTEGNDALASELFEVERSLSSGSRRLTRIVNSASR